MDRPLWQRTAIAAVALLLVGWLSYNYYFKNKFNEASTLKKTLMAVEKEIKLINQGNMILVSSTTATIEISNALKDISQKLPDEINMPSLMRDFITGSSKGLNIDYTLLQPLAIISGKNYKEIPISIDMLVSFEDLNLYLSRLDSLKNIVKINGLAISKNEKDQTLAAKMIVSLFVMSDGTSALSPEAKPNMIQLPELNPFFRSRFVAGTAAKSAVRAKRRVALPQFKGLYKGEVTKVFINNSIAGVGESVDGFSIVDIRDEKVIVSKGGIRYTLKLGR